MDPLGGITICDGGSSIVLSTTYLDSWLAALIAGYKRVLCANHVSVEVAEEPIALHIEVTPKGLLSISYENEALIPQPPEALETALKRHRSSCWKRLVLCPIAHGVHSLTQLGN